MFAGKKAERVESNVRVMPERFRVQELASRSSVVASATTL